MNFIILGIIFLVAVIGIIAVVYITKQSSIPDCSQQDGSSSGVATYKLNDDKSDCIPDTCASGYTLSTDQSTCVSTDCSKQDGTAVFVKSYKFDSASVACVPDTCVDGSTLSNGVCSTPPAPPPPPFNVQTAGNGSIVITPSTMRDPSGTYTVFLGMDGHNLIEIFHINGTLVYQAGPGANHVPVYPFLTGDGNLVFRTKDSNNYPLFAVDTGGHTTSDSYLLTIQPDGHLVIYAINPSGGNTGPVWSSNHGGY